ncbi:uncharacterized protein N7511_002997 [Penicillium nucicola]|uniref:uncharacterized protein n=1 Tax=Penicillium nucicola TaxID=1850975 RepID=UPI002544F9D9|nr:uncharacterized protein N7511_002997 [Penicillium nucicola]KAJ5770946.1 hypothetical protein N7511_002997 [Penicillium nucicola]
MSTENGVNNWETSFEKEVEVLRLASTEGNVTFLSIYQEKTVETAAAEASFLYHDLAAMDVSAMYDSSNVHQQLKEKSETAVKDTETSCDVLRNSLQEFKEGKADASESDWESFLDEEVEKHKAESNKRWDDLKKFGKEKIMQLPEASRPAAARTYGAGLSVIGKLLGTVMDWLKNVLNKIAEFFRKAWEKIKEFAGKAVEWCSNAWSSIAGIFSGVFSFAATAAIDKYSHSNAANFGLFPSFDSNVTVEQARQFLDLLSKITQERNLNGVHSALPLKAV